MWLGDVMVRGMAGWGRAKVDEARDMGVTGVVKASEGAGVALAKDVAGVDMVRDLAVMGLL